MPEPDDSPGATDSTDRRVTDRDESDVPSDGDVPAGPASEVMAPDGGTTDGHHGRARSEAAGTSYGGELWRRARAHSWFLLALVVGVLVGSAYVVGHEYPAYGAGLYLQIGEVVANHGYGLPAEIPLYLDGLPLAYPPLGMYLAAVVRNALGVGPLTYSMIMPSVLAVLYLVPYYGISLELLDSRRQAGFATILLATTPETLQWHLSAGGIVRSLGFLLALSGIYVGVRVFDRWHPRWVVAGIVLFGLTVLTHPVYTVFFGSTWVLLFLLKDRTPQGLATGVVVSTGGILLAAPWWVKVGSTHGLDTFFAAAGTHSGLGGGVGRFLNAFVYPPDQSITVVYYVATFAATFVFLSDRDFLLPAWLLAVGYLIGKVRFLFVPGSMMVAAVTFRYLLPRIRTEVRRRRNAGTSDGIGIRPDGGITGRTATRVFLGVVVVTATLIGGSFAAGALPEAHHGSVSQPAFIDAEDEEAMTWVQQNTAPHDDFVMLGDGAEWFPLLTDRSILIGPWGVEWTDPERYSHQLSLFRDISTCDGAACLSDRLDEIEKQPEYIYVPKDSFTVRGFTHTQSASMKSSLVESPEFRLAYENDGVMIFEVTDDESVRHDDEDEVPPPRTH